MCTLLDVAISRQARQGICTADRQTDRLASRLFLRHACMHGHGMDPELIINCDLPIGAGKSSAPVLGMDST